ncbi:UNVERIFIED_CONTAM: hypothetical protein RMT77_010161 [Armadillidium vulgare]
MSSGDGHKHHPDRHAGFPSKYQRKSSQVASHSSNVPNSQQPNQSQQPHANSYGIHFGHPQYQSHNVIGSSGLGHRHPHHISSQNYPADNQVGNSQIQTRSQQDNYGENRQLPSYPEPPKYPGQRVEESHKDRKPPPEDDGGMHSWRSMRLEELKDMCQSQINELRISREQIQRLTDDNQELRDLCCFLDDDRQKGRKLAREWQRFGRYTASVMRQEVSAYQNKLRELDTKQQELIKDNLELKELCLYLDEERSNATCAHCGHPISLRDDGDGSSSSTNADDPTPPHIHQTPHSVPPPPTNSHIPLSRSSSRELLMHDSVVSQRSAFNEQILSYIRSLEARILLLETEKQTLSEELVKGGRTLPEGEGSRENENPEGSSNGEYHRNHRPPHPPPYSLAHQMRALGLGIGGSGPLSQEGDDDPLGLPPPPPVSRPAAVAAAMRVLEVQEQLESPPPPPPPNINTLHTTHPTMNQQMSHIHSHSPSSASYFNQHNHGSQDSALADGEKAILRQMCNVVWKKLEEVPSEHR